MIDRKHFFKELNRKDNSREFYSESMDRIWRSWIVIHTDEGGYIESDMNFTLFKDGDFMISDNDGDDCINLNKEEVKNFISIMGTIQNDSEN